MAKPSYTATVGEPDDRPFLPTRARCAARAHDLLTKAVNAANRSFADVHLAAATQYVELAKVMPDLLTDDDVTGPIPDQRCASCDHKLEMHSEPGCWYTVTLGDQGKSLGCPCTFVPHEAQP